MIGRTSTQFTFAAVPYANAAPLAHFLPQVHADVAVIFAPPSQLAQAVIDGRADAALVPVVDCFANPELRMSNALARVLLADHFGLSVEIRPFDPDESPDAAVVIGDRALQAPPAPGGDIDLAGQWKLMTSLPFVFAVWAHRADHPDPQGLAETARAARDAGVAAIDELASIWAERLGLNFQRCRDYLGSAIHYDLGPRERAGMQLFKELLAGRQAATSSVSGREGSGG
ncbi:MAG: menaquinone biosynthetic enzyme MqnA/MqnD family protein [Planctomycetota bacterium]|jgi:predicted solute-binding protein